MKELEKEKILETITCPICGGDGKIVLPEIPKSLKTKISNEIALSESIKELRKLGYGYRMIGRLTKIYHPETVKYWENKY